MRVPQFVRLHRFAFALGLIALAGFVLRVVYAVANRRHVVGGDGFRYHFGAILLADGHGFVNPLNRAVVDTGHPPGFTIVLAGATKLGLRTWLEHGLVNSVIGTATIVVVGLAGRSAFGRPRVGLVAAALAAVYPFTWLYEREVLSEPLAMLLIATTIWLAYEFRTAPNAVRAVALGGLVGVMAVTESELLAVSVLLVAPLILSRREVEFRRRVGWLAAAAVLCVVILAPWSIYLSTRYHHAVLVSGVGGTLAAGNCAPTYHGELYGYYATPCVFNIKNPSGNPLALDAQYRHLALDFMRAHKSEVPGVVAARIGRTFGVFRPFQQMRLETERGTSESVIRIGFFAYWALVPFAIGGIVLARRRRATIYPLLVFFVVVVLSVAPGIGAVRYRAPAEISFVILAAVGIEGLLSLRTGEKREPREPRGRRGRETRSRFDLHITGL